MSEFERTQKFALEFGGYLLREDAKPFVQPMSHNNREQAEKRLVAQVSQCRVFHYQSGPLLAPELEALLTSEAASLLRQEIEQFQRHLLSGLRIHDVRTEVLASWLGLAGSSDSSSVSAVGESAGELPTPPRTRIVAHGVARVDGDAGEMVFECDGYEVVR